MKKGIVNIEISFILVQRSFGLEDGLEVSF